MKQFSSIEKFVLDISWEDFPKIVQDHAVKCLLDLIGVFCAGSRTSSTKMAADFAYSFFPGTEATIFSSGKKTSLIGAAMANAGCANALDMDDGFSLLKGHPGAGILGGLLAAAEYSKCTYREFLTALVVGYEVTIRQGIAIQDYYSFYHSTGSYAAFGTVACVGRLLGLSEKKLFNAFSIADYFAPMTPCMRSVKSPSMNKDGIYLGAQLGMQAALMAREGIYGGDYILSDDKYYAEIDSLGTEYKFLKLYFKFYACCRWAHSAIRAALTLTDSCVITIDEIVHIHIESFNAAGALFEGYPQNEEEAQYNLRYPIAAALLYGDCGPAEVTEKAFRNKNITRLMDSMSFSVKPEYDAMFPERRVCEMTIETIDGKVFKSGPCEPSGERSVETTMKEVREKFYKITRDVLHPEKAKELIDWLEDKNMDRPMDEFFTLMKDGLGEKR
ncbi:2-methylcitrate dehydratase [Spirochaetia bacterium]|nr:2-methylcitrate dehydratase [Spirochaetia bacterium]